MVTSVAARARRYMWPGIVVVALLLAAGLILPATRPASAATSQTLDLKVLLIGNGASDPTTGAWESALSTEGVPYTEVTAAGTAPNQTVSLPALSSGSTGNYNGVVITDDPADFASGQLSALDSYESTFGVRQVDGYAFPTATLGQTYVSSGLLDGTTGTLTSAGLAAFPELSGPVPFDTGTFGYLSTANAGAPFTPLITNSAGDVLAGVYQHPSTDAQAGVSELALNFDYNVSQLQWLLLAPGLINWVTQGTHLGLYRNYFGQDIDDTFLADNEWSSTFQCTPAATNPPDYTCPAAEQGVPPGSAPGVPADAQMTAADVSYVTSWEQQTGIKLNLVFNGAGACTAPSATAESSANCTGSVTDNGTTYTDPGQVVDTGSPNDQGLVNALLTSQGSFNWINHTWSHMFLGCTNWQPQPLTSATAGSGGSLSAGTYSYEITAATAYGESEPSAPQQATVSSGGSVALTWPDAPNGTGADGTTPGPSLATLKSEFGGGTGFWGYNIYREDPGSTTYGLVGQVPEGSGSTYTFTDNGTATPGAAPGSSSTFPTATDPGIDCSSAAGSWLPATSTTPDSSIEQEIGLNQAFAAANGLTNFDSHDLVTGEFSGVESPNMPAALNATGVTTFAQDASRQPQQYSLGSAEGAPRYPSNIYYNASNWPDELNEYNTLYVQQGDSIGNNQVGHCEGTNATTCRTTPAAEADVLAAESRTMLGHVLYNDPRVGYAHQTNLIGPATQNGADYGYTILDLISDMLSQYDSWYNATTTPLDQVTDTTEAQALGEQSAWAKAESGGNYTASETSGTVTVTNNGSAVAIPVTVPTGTTAGGAAFGQAYGGGLSDWVSLAANATETLTEPANAASTPAPKSTKSGARPAGLTSNSPVGTRAAGAQAASSRTKGSSWLAGARSLTRVTTDLAQLSAAERAGNHTAAQTAGQRLAADAGAALSAAMPPVDAASYRSALDQLRTAGSGAAGGQSGSAAARQLLAGETGLAKVTAAADTPVATKAPAIPVESAGRSRS